MTVKVMTWYNEDGGIVRDKTPLGALNARKTNNANTAGPVFYRVIKVTKEFHGLKGYFHIYHNNLSIDVQ
jgi:hypothetical protein